MRLVAVLVGALALVEGAAAVRTATVTVRDAALAPARVRIDAGGTVTWRNAGTRAHRIASRTGVFAAFTLAPGARRSVRFGRNGAHGYTVDGRRCGIVYVGVRLGPGCTGGGGTPRLPSPGTKIHTYDVVIRGSIKNEGFVDSGGRREQAWTREYTWTSTFQRFRFKVITTGGRFIGVNALGRAVASTARVTESWDYFWHPHALFPPDADCEGTVTGVVPSALAVATSNISTPNYYVISQLPGGWNKDAEIQARCNGWSPPTTQVTAFGLADGSRVEVDVGTLTIDKQRRTGGLRDPAGALAAGRSFSIDTGERVSRRATCEGSCSGTLTMTERYVAIFTRRP